MSQVPLPGAQTSAIQYRTMARIVADYLRSAILSGRLGPGDKIQQDEIARQLGVSRMPVRDALRIVQSEGLVEIYPHRAAVVVSLRPQDIIEIFEIRALLEGRAAELAAAHLSDAIVAHLHEVYAAMDTILREWDHDRWLQLNREFHSTIYAASGWTRLCSIIDTQLNTLFPYQRAASSFVERRLTAHHEHGLILQAAKQRDAALLGQRTAEHLRATARDLVEYISTHRGTPAGSGAGPMVTPGPGIGS